MPRRSGASTLGLALLLLAGGHAAQADEPLELELLAEGLSQPLGLTHAGDGSGRLFILEQAGRILIHDGTGVLATPFLDLSSRVGCCGERGLLGLAFHPDYAANGFLFVDYTDSSGRTIISRFAVSADPNRADASSETEVLSFAQPFANHNGGQLAFGPDGYLYIGSGDGGGGGDQQNNGQQLDTLLGKILRIDVDGLPLAIPPDNPFVGDPAARDEIWAYGLRNPWRFSFDRHTGDLFIADVGQERREEVDFQGAGSPGGENYGWRRMEGSLCFQPSSGCNDGSLVLPILEYDHGLGCSVTGGYVYRGEAAPGLRGTYLFGDFCSGRIWGATPGASGVWSAVELADTELSISSFGEDEAGELYVVDLAGAVYRLSSPPILTDGFESGDASAWARARGNLEVVQPGLAGTAYSLEVSVDGTGRKSFLLTRRPRRERLFKVGFHLKANRVELGNGEVTILQLLGGGRRHVKLTLEEDGARYWVNLFVRSNTGGFELVGRSRVKRRRAVRLRVEWRRASGPGAEDGVVRLVKGKRVRAEKTDLDNHRLVVQALRAGLPAGSRGALDGSFFLDEFLLTQ